MSVYIYIYIHTHIHTHTVISMYAYMHDIRNNTVITYGLYFHFDSLRFKRSQHKQ